MMSLDLTGELPELPVHRLLLITTGSAYASSLPQWLDWLQFSYPKLELQMVVTRSAERFVTRQALAARLHEDVALDEWPAQEATARHVRWAEWAEAIVVYPATVHFLARLALGLADSPALLAAHCTTAPVVVAPALPPGALDSEVCQRHWEALAGRRNVTIVPPVLGRSLTTGREGTWSPPPLPEVLRLLAEQYPTLTAAPATAGGDVADPATIETHGTEFGTGLLRTRVVPDRDGGYRWRRTPGPAAPAPFRRLPEPVRDQLAEVEAGAAAVVVGESDGAARGYRVRGFESAAGRLLRHGPEPELATPVRQLGALLRQIHAVSAPTTVERGSPGLARLGDWLAGKPRRLPAVAVLGAVRRGLGDDRWRTVTQWYQELLTDEELTLSHGGAGLGALVVTPDRATADLLTGEDVCRQPWYVDLGWVVGELVELKWQIGGEAEDWQRLINALFEGYGRDLGEQWHRLAALRVLLHVHDFGAYVHGPGEWVDRYVGFLRFLIDV